MKWLTLKKVMAIIIAITLLSCTKFGKNITVKGRVLNPITGETYSGIKIEFLKSKHLQYNGGYKVINTAFSDENGNFEISAYRLGVVWAQAQIGAENYDLGWYYEGKYYSRMGVPKGKTMNVDYHLVPYGNIKLTINNINCEGGGTQCILGKNG